VSPRESGPRNRAAKAPKNRSCAQTPALRTQRVDGLAPPVCGSIQIARRSKKASKSSFPSKRVDAKIGTKARPAEGARGMSNARLPGSLPSSMALIPQELMPEYWEAYPSLHTRMPAVFAWLLRQDAPNGDDTARLHGLPGKPPPGPSHTLTQAEQRLADFLAGGGTLANFAHLRSLSRNTVRNQLRSIFTKLGVNRQADLVRVLLHSKRTGG
jgi:DNA-binding CsgD family transcriptional regulator